MCNVYDFQIHYVFIVTALLFLGLYIIGNMSNLVLRSKLWENINNTLIEQNSIGPEIALECKNHGIVTKVSIVIICIHACMCLSCVYFAYFFVTCRFKILLIFQKFLMVVV